MTERLGENGVEMSFEEQKAKLFEWLGIDKNCGVVTDYVNNANGFGLCLETKEMAERLNKPDAVERAKGSLFKWMKNFVPYRVYLERRIASVNGRIFDGSLDQPQIAQITEELMAVAPAAEEINGRGYELAEKFAAINTTDEAMSLADEAGNFIATLKQKTGRGQGSMIFGPMGMQRGGTDEGLEIDVHDERIAQMRDFCEAVLGRKLTIEELSIALYLQDQINDVVRRAEGREITVLVEGIRQIIGSTKFLQRLVTSDGLKLVERKARAGARGEKFEGVVVRHPSRPEYRI